MSETRNSSLLGKITVAFVICYIGTVGLCINTVTALPGSGTEAEPWRIESLEDFNEFAADANYWAGYTRLETDVNLAGQTYYTAVITPDADNSGYPFDGTPFNGVFDGNDHKITNLTIDDGGVGNYYLGLFGSISSEGEVRNLGLEGGSVNGDCSVGGLVGSNSGSISNCYFTGEVNGSHDVGGLVGENHYHYSSNSYVNISNCYSIGDVSGANDVGGLVGENNGRVWDCYSTGDVNGVDYVGGLMGRNSEDVWDCYSTGGVNGVNYVGGLMGRNGEDVWNCYSTGDVNGVNYYAGGLMGRSVESVWNCFWDTDTQTHGVTDSIGYEGTFINVSGLTTTQMQTRSTFTDAGWDFINIWNIGENQTYPYLRVYLAGDINKDGIVNFFDFAIETDQWMEGDKTDE